MGSAQVSERGGGCKEEMGGPYGTGRTNCPLETLVITSRHYVAGSKTVKTGMGLSKGGP